MRALQTTAQVAVNGPLSFPPDAKTAQVGKILADFRKEVEDSSKSNFKRRGLAAREDLGIRVFEWMKQLEALAHGSLLAPSGRKRKESIGRFFDD